MNLLFKQRSSSHLPLLLIFVCLLLYSACAWCVDPSRHISQYVHGTWRTQEGAFSGFPIVVTQTTDGYLWIGTNVGLVRFDGVHFVAWNPPPGERLLDSRIFSLRAARDGSLWIGTGYSVSHWKDGRLINLPQLSGRIESLVEDVDGAVWLVRTQATDGKGPVCRVKDDQFRCYGATDGIPFPLAIELEEDNSGFLWIGGYSELCRWRPGSAITYFANTHQRPETFALQRALATARDGSVWAAIEQHARFLQLEHFEPGGWIHRSFPAIPVDSGDVTTLFADRDNALWVGTAHHGIFRAQGENVDHFGNTDGLSSDAVIRFYQDAEGTLWVVTSEGLDNFRDVTVANYSMREGLSAAGASSVLASRDGTIWIGNFEALEVLRDNRLSAIRARQGLPGRNVTTLFEDHAGRIWLGVDAGLWVYDHGTFRAIRRADGSALGIVFAITEDVLHNVWVRAGPNLDRIHDFTLQDEFTSPQISSAYTLAANPRGGIVMGLVNGDLLQYKDGKTQTSPSGEIGNTRQIRDLLVEADGSVWGTTVDEVARWKDGVRKNLTTRNGLPCDGIFALIKDNQDSLWLYSRCGLITIEKAQLDYWWEHPDGVVQLRLFDAFDGVQPGLTSLKPQAARSPDGRLWFVNGHLLQVMDPERQGKNLIPPPVQIEGVIADHKNYALDKNLRLPPLTRDLEIDYTALSFVAPQKVRFRYKLEGHDAGWQEAGARRQAFYTGLAPGSYHFRVIASNNDGVWNETGNTLDLSVAPAWFQQSWFRVLCVAFLAFAAWGLYQLRVRQIARTFGARFDARLAERTRIARDLHDTLLQTIQGSKLVAEHSLEKSSDPVQMRRGLKQLSVWLGQATREGRTALNSLRTSSTETNDLASAFRRALEDCRRESSMEAVFSATGQAREMHPVVRDEVYRIGYEAIRNAYIHSAGSRVDVALSYAEDLSLKIRDNGIGIDPAIAGAGRDGHYGLQGMRERAARLGARLTLVTSANSGTEVKVVVPGRIVFRKPRATPFDKIKTVLNRPGKN